MDQIQKHRVGKKPGRKMTFEDFAHAHGLIFQGLVMGRWMSTPTEDHPHKRNGRYKCLGNVGWVQNWATMEKPEIWRGEGNIVTVLHQDNREREQRAEQAASKAAWLLHQARLDTHPYLRAKGFPDEAGNVWEQKLVIPMRMNGRLAGAQLIDDQGIKKFLYGQKSKGASFVIDAKGIPIFCEGYATGLSVRAAMKAMKVSFTPAFSYSTFFAARSSAMCEKSTWNTECAWADVRRLSTMCSAIFLRMVESVSTRSFGPTPGTAGFVDAPPASARMKSVFVTRPSRPLPESVLMSS